MPLFIRTCGISMLAALAPGFDEVIRVMPGHEHVHDRPRLAIPVTTVEVSDLDDWGEDELAAIARDHPEQIVPGSKHVEAILAAGRRAMTHPDRRVLLHCAAGISRSVAAALAILALEDGPGRERHSADRLREACGHRQPLPNMRLVRLADEALDRGGNLCEAWKHAVRADQPDNADTIAADYEAIDRAAPADAG